MINLSRHFFVAIAAFFVVHAPSLYPDSHNSDGVSSGIDMTSRFVMNIDPSDSVVAGIHIPKVWWSRHHEYTWAGQFVDPRFVVLDAACGVEHPFKWHLANTCHTVWACDLDPRIEDKDRIFEASEWFGPESYNTLTKTIYPWNNVFLLRASVTALPNSMPLFDRIFCISTLEHMSISDRKAAFEQFCKKLAPGGLVVITMDYPMCTPEEILRQADEAGLVPAGAVVVGTPPAGALTWGILYVYRCVLKRKM